MIPSLLNLVAYPTVKVSQKEFDSYWNNLKKTMSEAEWGKAKMEADKYRKQARKMKDKRLPDYLRVVHDEGINAFYLYNATSKEQIEKTCSSTIDGCVEIYRDYLSSEAAEERGG